MKRYFDNINDLNELKNQYKKLARQYHPDLHPGEEATYTPIMQAINEQYTEAFNRIHSNMGPDSTAQEGYYATETADDYIRIVEALMKFKGIAVELCGSWLWISGDTYAVHVDLRALGCEYSKSKKIWYWHPGPIKKTRRTAWSQDKVRATFGSIKLKDRDEYRDGGSYIN